MIDHIIDICLRFCSLPYKERKTKESAEGELLAEVCHPYLSAYEPQDPLHHDRRTYLQKHLGFDTAM